MTGAPRRLRANAAQLALLGLLVATAAMVSTAAPRRANAIIDEGLRREVAAAPRSTTDLHLQARGQDAGVDAAARQLDPYLRRQPAPLRAAVTGSWFAASTAARSSA